MNIGVCVPLNSNTKTTQSAGPISYLTDTAADRAEAALRSQAEEASSSQESTE